MNTERGWWIIIGLVVGLSTAFLGARLFDMASATTIPGERLPITTTGLTIINHAGQPRVNLKLWDGEHPALLFSDDRCSQRASLVVSPRERVALTMFGEDCKRRVSLELQANDVPTLVLRDTKDTPRARLHLLNDGNPILEFLDPMGKILQRFPAQKK